MPSKMYDSSEAVGEDIKPVSFKSELTYAADNLVRLEDTLTRVRNLRDTLIGNRGFEPTCSEVVIPHSDTILISLNQRNNATAKLLADIEHELSLIFATL